MERIVLTDGSGRWFAADRARKWRQAPGERRHREALYCTAGGVYVLCRWWPEARPYCPDTYTEISATQAAVWLSRNEYASSDAVRARVGAEFAALEIT